MPLWPMSLRLSHPERLHTFAKCMAMSRNGKVYPDPETFKPDRFMNPSDGMGRSMMVMSALLADLIDGMCWSRFCQRDHMSRCRIFPSHFQYQQSERCGRKRDTHYRVVSRRWCHRCLAQSGIYVPELTNRNHFSARLRQGRRRSLTSWTLNTQ
ncbi:hypothetical protein C8J56DRAFT_356767 [Mycena floridula]|nr:hypothetical protein C8J56DRAFT_356767 [Mycena floridula]